MNANKIFNAYLFYSLSTPGGLFYFNITLFTTLLFLTGLNSDNLRYLAKIT